MKTIATPAIILRRIDYGEADRILTLLTPEQGKISAIAKGSRKAKSKLAGGLELFSESNITLIDGKSELKTIVSTQLITHFSAIAEKLERAMFAYECLKIVDKNTESTCESAYYELLREVLRSLSDSSCSLSVVQAWFYATLLHIRGEGINLDTQADGSGFDEHTAYHFDFDTMSFIKHESGPYEPKHIKLLRLFSKVSTPKNLLHIAEAEVLSFDLANLLQRTVKLQIS